MLTEERARLWARAALLALGLAAPLAAVVSPRPGGDYPCFWAAGRLALAGASPYDADALRALEAPWVAAGGWLPFAYPPAVAALHGAIAWLPYRAAWLAYTGVAAAAAVAIPFVLAPLLPRATAWREPAVLGVLWFPALRAVAGGQGTSLLALALAGALRLLRDDRPFLAGLVAGAALLKPTIGLPLVGLVALGGGWRAAAGSAVAAAAVWLASAAVAGPDWILEWWRIATAFQAEAQAVEGAGNVGLLGAAEHALGYGSLAARIVGGAGAAVIVAALVAAWARPASPATRAGVTAALLPLLPPHSVWYDAGLGGIALLAIAERGAPPLAVALAWAAGASAAFAGALGFQPLVLVLLALAIAAWRRDSRG